MLGFQTMGSALLVLFDGEPLLSTDAWLNDSAYFGSWTHDYPITEVQKDVVRRCRYHWFSHGHPDHLNVLSLPELSGGEILLADHRGGRIYRDLKQMGLNVRIMKDKEWMVISPRIKIMTIANSNQDSCLLIDLNGRLIINVNDAPDLGWGRFIRSLARNYRRSYLLQLSGWGSADMANLFRPDGVRVEYGHRRHNPIGAHLQASAARFGASAAIPFSSFHRFQRTDSAWANALIPSLDDYHQGVRPGLPEVLPAFVSVDCQNDDLQTTAPVRAESALQAPERFGDSWSDQLEKSEETLLRDYFHRKEAIRRRFGFLTFRVGGRECTVDLRGSHRDVGIVFEVPRQSLMTAVRNQVFDDLLIGNFMKTTLYGISSLYPEFSPFVAKYADNGGAQTLDELSDYHRHYRRRDPVGHYLNWLECSADRLVRATLPEDSAAFSLVKSAYWWLRR